MTTALGRGVQWARGQMQGGRLTALVYLAGSLLGRAAGIVLIPLYTRQLSVEAYGHLALWNTVVLFFGGIGALGMQSVVPREFFSGSSAQGHAGAVTVARWGIGLTAASAVFGLFVTMLVPQGHLGGLSSEEVRIAFAAGFGALATGTLVQFFKVRQLARRAVFLELAGLLTSVGCSYWLVVVQQMGVRGAILASCVSALSTGLIATAVVFTLPAAKPTKPFATYMRLAIPTVPHFAAGWFLGQSDRWALQLGGRESQLGLYALAATIASPGGLVLSAFHDAYGARIGEMFREGGVARIRAMLPSIRKRYLAVALVAWVCSSFVASMAALFAVSSNYRGAVWPALLLGLLPVCDVPYYSDSNILYYSDRTPTQSIITTCAAGVSVGAMALGGLFFGMWGVLGGRALGLLFRSAATALVAHRISAATPVSLP